MITHGVLHCAVCNVHSVVRWPEHKIFVKTSGIKHPLTEILPKYFLRHGPLVQYQAGDKEKQSFHTR